MFADIWVFLQKVLVCFGMEYNRGSKQTLENRIEKSTFLTKTDLERKENVSFWEVQLGTLPSWRECFELTRDVLEDRIWNHSTTLSRKRGLVWHISNKMRVTWGGKGQSDVIIALAVKERPKSDLPQTPCICIQNASFRGLKRGDRGSKARNPLHVPILFFLSFSFIFKRPASKGWARQRSGQNLLRGRQIPNP